MPILLLVRKGAQRQFEADRRRGGNLEIMLARLTQEVLRTTLGKSLDEETYASKVKDLLIGVLR